MSPTLSLSTQWKPKRRSPKACPLLLSHCDTLISSGDHFLSACDLRLTTSKCLIPIVVESVKFRDVSERKHPKTQKWGVNLSNIGGALRKLHLEHSRRWGWTYQLGGVFRKLPQETSRGGEFIKMGCAQKSSSGSLWAATTSLLLL